MCNYQKCLSLKGSGYNRNWQGPLIVPFFGRAADVERAGRWRYFSGWTSPIRYEPPADVEKTFKFFELKDQSVAIKVSEPFSICLALLCRCCILKQICFSHMWELCQAPLAGRLHVKKLHMHGDNFLHERGGQRFWCWVASWREHVMQHFDGVP